MIALLGLSDAGKSSWLGCLLDILEDARGDLRLAKQQAAYAVLDGYRQALLSGRYPEHTKIEDHLPNHLDLIWKGEPRQLDVSDYSGERISRLHTRHSHQWDRGWEERAACTRLAILLRVDQVVRIQRRPRSPAGGVFSQDLVPDEDHGHEPRRPPTALALIEALQAMRLHRGRGLGEPGAAGEERFAVVLTAWDRAGDVDPRTFLEDHAPLLTAWLDTNVHPGDVGVFGLSASGGDLGDPTHAARVNRDGLAKIAYCCTGSPAQRHFDASLPLQWLLGAE